MSPQSTFSHSLSLHQKGPPSLGLTPLPCPNPHISQVDPLPPMPITGDSPYLWLHPLRLSCLRRRGSVRSFATDDAQIAHACLMLGQLWITLCGTRRFMCAKCLELRGCGMLVCRDTLPNDSGVIPVESYAVWALCVGLKPEIQRKSAKNQRAVGKCNVHLRRIKYYLACEKTANTCV